MHYSRSYIGLAAMALCGLLLSSPAAAQCVDGSTTIYWVNHLWRTASNNVDALAGTQIVGDYWYTWAGSISSTEQVASTTIHSGFGGVGYGGNNGFLAGGTAAGLQWDDSPSSTGAGAYSLSNSHVAWSQCGDYYPFSTSDSLTVNKPTMTGYDAVWFLGATGQNQSGYANITYETAHSNCGAADTCTDTPSWTATGNTSEISFSCNPCAVQTVGGATRSNTFHDIQITVGIGGFASDPLPFTVYAPYNLTCCNSTTNVSNFDGFLTTVTMTLNDRFNDPLVGLALNESFTATLVSDYLPGLSGWGQPTAAGLPAGWTGSIADKMGAYDNTGGTGCSTVANPHCTHPQVPLSTITAMHNNQSWQVGNSIVGYGLQVRTDTQQFYVDHALYTFPVSPTQP